MKRMSLKRFGRIVRRVLETLPEELRHHLDNVVVDIEDEPGEEIGEEESAYGFFMPIDLPSLWGSDAVPVHDMPHRIVIYKHPLEDDFPDRRQLAIEIRKTVIHELAHHFGYTDRDLERFDDNPDPFGDNLLDDLV